MIYHSGLAGEENKIIAYIARIFFEFVRISATRNYSYLAGTSVGDITTLL